MTEDRLASLLDGLDDVTAARARDLHTDMRTIGISEHNTVQLLDMTLRARASRVPDAVSTPGPT